MEPVKIIDNIYWVGAVDASVRDFHGYLTEQGSTYNAYLIMDEKVTLVDVVKDGFGPELLSRISKVIDPSKIDQVVSNHSEMDHSGCLPEVMKVIGMEKPVYCSPMGEKALSAQFKGAGLNLQTVKTGDSLSLGKMDLKFLETRMIHWPDSMFSFCPQNGILFSQDGFGMHLATTERFDDEVCSTVLEQQGLRYFSNILTPYTGNIAKAIEGVVSSGLINDIKMICPDHGPIWRTDPGFIVNLYVKWCKQAPTRKAVVVFDTMWHSTEKMAHELNDALGQLGVQSKLMSLKSCHRSSIITEAYEAGAILVGSPTLNNEMYPSVASFLCYLKGLKLQNKIGAAFGSYGWSGEAAKHIQAELTAMKFNLPSPEVRYQWVPDEAGLAPMKPLAKAVADLLPKEKAPVVCGH